MKKFLFLLTVIALVFITSCKEAPPPPAPTPSTVAPLQQISLEQFVRTIGDLPEVKALEFGKSLNVAINPEKVLSPTAEFAVVEKFKSEWTYAELLSVNKQIPLTIVWGEPGERFLVLDYKDLADYKLLLDRWPKNKFTILDPKPAYVVKVGKKIYWVSPGKNLWKTW